MLDTEDLLLAFDESKIKRVPKGSQGGGRFSSIGSSGAGDVSLSGKNKAAKKKVVAGKTARPNKIGADKEHKEVKKLHKEVKKLHGESKELHSPEAIVKHTAAGIALEAAYHKLKPKVKTAAVTAAAAMRRKFGQEVVKEGVSKPITKAIGSGAKKALEKRPGWKVIAERSKKLLQHPIVKKSFELLKKTGKFAVVVAASAAPYLVNAAKAAGIFLTTATLPELVLAGTIAAATAYAIHRVHKSYTEKKNNRKFEEMMARYNSRYAH